MVATLRGIVEDLIVLCALAKLPRGDRSTLLQSWIQLNVLDGLKRQVNFFRERERPQSVLQPPLDVAERTKALRSQMSLLWKQNGYDPSNMGTGNTRTLAEASNLLELYDFVWNLGSRLVHFNPNVLLRMGWGDMSEDGAWTFTFGPAHFNSYYGAVVMGYSTLLPAEFIDRLGGDLELPALFSESSNVIRADLRELRLPELVTYEEMNREPPNAVWRSTERAARSNSRIRGQKVCN